MNGLPLLWMILIFWSCTQSPSSLETKEIYPAWVFDPMAHCSEDKEICAVGEGNEDEAAQARARLALAQVFQTRVVSDSRISKNVEQEGDHLGMVSGSLGEEAQTQIREVTDLILNGVQIKARFKGKSHFVLATLDKRAAARHLKAEMEMLDEKIRELYSSRSLRTYSKMKRLYEARQALNLRYQQLEGALLPNPIPYPALVAKKPPQEKLPAISFPWKRNRALKDLGPWITRLLTENDFKVVEDPGKPSQYSLKGDLLKKRAFLKVDGFKKYHFTLVLDFENHKGEKINSLELNLDQVGRNEEEIYQAALSDMRKFLQEKFQTLEID